MPPHSSTHRHGSSSQASHRRASSATSVTDHRATPVVSQTRRGIPDQDPAADIREIGSLFYTSDSQATRSVDGHQPPHLSVQHPAGRDMGEDCLTVGLHEDHCLENLTKRDQGAVRTPSQTGQLCYSQHENAVQQLGGQSAQSTHASHHCRTRQGANGSQQRSSRPTATLRPAPMVLHSQATTHQGQTVSTPSASSTDHWELGLHDANMATGDDMALRMRDWQARWEALSSR